MEEPDELHKAYKDLPPLPPNIIDAIERILSKIRYAPNLREDRLARASATDVIKYSYPVDMKRWWISQYFGANPGTYYPLKGHDGIDIACNMGTNGGCPSGWIKITNLILQKNSYGRHIWGIDEYGHRHIFGHVHEWLCDVGSEFTRGQTFFTTGGNLDDPYHGFSSGPHLHWEWRPSWASISNGYAGAENQFPFVTFGDVVPIPQPEPKPLFYMVVNTEGLQVRSTPMIPWNNNNRTGEKLKAGTTIPIYATDLLDGRLFAKISARGSKYACFQENKIAHMAEK